PPAAAGRRRPATARGPTVPPRRRRRTRSTPAPAPAHPAPAGRQPARTAPVDRASAHLIRHEESLPPAVQRIASGQPAHRQPGATGNGPPPPVTWGRGTGDR